jgi:hypothetical protein
MTNHSATCADIEAAAELFMLAKNRYGELFALYVACQALVVLQPDISSADYELCVHEILAVADEHLLSQDTAFEKDRRLLH